MDGDGRVRVAGSWTPFILSTMLAVGAAPELIDPRQWGFTDTRATVANNVYVFAVLAWEVGEKEARNLVVNH